jgi:hypothetical protein
VIDKHRRWAALGDFQRQPVNAGEICRNVEIGIIGERDRQSRATEVDLILDSIDGLTKFAIGIVSQFYAS